MIERRFIAMGGDVIVGGGTTADHAAIERLFAEREVVFSRFVPQSELNRVNASAGRLMVVSPLFAETLRIALDAADETEGSVRPTLGGALEAAGYTRDSSVPTPDAAPPATPPPPTGGRVLAPGPGWAGRGRAGTPRPRSLPRAWAAPPRRSHRRHLARSAGSRRRAG